jgi:hypothetical protein
MRMKFLSIAVAITLTGINCFAQNTQPAIIDVTNKENGSYDFVHALWNAKLEPYEDGYFDPYFDGLMYLFSLMHLSGKYQIIQPPIK